MAGIEHGNVTNEEFMEEVARYECIYNRNSKAPFIWRKVVPGKRVTLLAESTLPSVYMRKKLTPLPEPRANFPIKTELAHAPIVSP